MTVAHILKTKGQAVHSALGEETLGRIAKTLADKRIGALLIVGPDETIEGIVSERDIVRALAAHGPKALGLKARDIMTTRLHTCSPLDSEAELMSLMTLNRIRHLPVLEAGRLAGMISIGDVVKYRMEAVEREAEEMKAYISSAG